MRHGIAEDGWPDEDRALTEVGRERVRDMGRLLDRLGLRPDVVFSSPRVRARQTAEIVLETLGIDEAPLISSALDFHGTWEDLAGLLATPPRGKADPGILLATGHQPHLGDMTSMALFGEMTGMELRKGACVGLRFPGGIEPAGARLDFLLTPRLARSVPED